MAQSGFTPILLYASGTPGNSPSAGNLTSSASGAELAVNYADGKLFYKDSGGSVQTLATKGTGSIGGSTTQVQYNLSGALAGSANLTFNGTTLTANSAAVSTGNLSFSGTAQRITGDMSNATVANRLMFQTSTVNGATGVAAIPNGTGAFSAFECVDNSDIANGALGYIGISGGSDVRIVATRRGTGSFLPIALYTGGSERMRIDTSGNVGVGTASPNGRLQLSASSTDTSSYYNGARLAIQNTSATNNNFTDLSFVSANGNDYAAIWGICSAHTASAAAGSLVFGTANGASVATERMRIDSSGNVGIGAASTFDRLYVAGSATIAYPSADTYLSFKAAYSHGYISYTNASNIFTIWNVQNAAITFGTNNTERMRIDSSGNVGIGTASPGYALEINKASGNFRVRDASAGNDVAITTIAGPVSLIGSTGATAIAFGTNATEWMRITSAGNIGIGTAAPAAAYQIDVQANTNSYWGTRIYNLSSGASASTAMQFGNDTNGAAAAIILASSTNTSIMGGANALAIINGLNAPMAFGTNSIERMRIDASGNVGIGTANPGTILNVYSASSAVFSLDGDAAVNVRASRYSTDATGPSLSLRKFRGSLASPAAVATNDFAGNIQFSVYGGTNSRLVGSINCQVTNYTSDTNISTALIFNTTNASTAAAERMRITATGNIVAGASAALATTATDGFLYVPTCAGTPTGTPTAITGMAPIVVNTTNNKLYFYSGGAWRDAGP